MFCKPYRSPRAHTKCGKMADVQRDAMQARLRKKKAVRDKQKQRGFRVVCVSYEPRESQREVFRSSLLRTGRSGRTARTGIVKEEK